MSTLDDVRDELAAMEAASPRSQQVQTGASQIFGCRAESLLRLTGVPESDPRSSWPALVGKAVHRLVEDAAAEDVITEARFTYRGVPATVDRYNPATKTLTDFKTKDTAADINAIRRAGPSREYRSQIHLGAAALIAAGHEVQTVELLFIPRAGTLEDAWLFSEPFDREIADDAAEWVSDQAERALTVDLDDGDPLDGLRDKLPSWCASYCPYFTTCRGGEEPLPELDDRLFEIAQRYLDADSREKDAAEEKRLLRADLDDVTGERDGLRVRWQGGNTKHVEEVDVERALEEYQLVVGELPTKTITKTTARSLRVEKVKPKKAKK